MSEHEHTHASDRYPENRTAIAVALAITVTMMAAEFIGGFLSGSLALISDAGHMLTDAASLALVFFTLWYARMPATREKTYGFHRAEILSALFNGALLTLISVYIFYEAFQRFIHPAAVRGPLMLVIAVLGLAANLAGAFVLSRGSRENLNVRGALWHIVSDALSSVGVIIGGAIITLTGFYLVDPILGVMIGVAVLRGAWGLIRESVDILLEAVPSDIDLDELDRALRSIGGVRDVHDIHVWTITSGVRAFSAHVLIDDALVSQCEEISRSAKNILRDKFSISHAIIEFECNSCEGSTACSIRSGTER